LTCPLLGEIFVLHLRKGLEHNRMPTATRQFSGQSFEGSPTQLRNFLFGLPTAGSILSLAFHRAQFFLREGYRLRSALPEVLETVVAHAETGCFRQPDSAEEQTPYMSAVCDDMW